jgi:hypothetical protein
VRIVRRPLACRFRKSPEKSLPVSLLGEAGRLILQNRRDKMHTLRATALAGLLALTLSGCNSRAHDAALADAIVSAQDAQAHRAALANAIDALHLAIQQQYTDGQPYNIKAQMELCEGTANECARQAFIRATRDRVAVADARIDCIHFGGTSAECDGN